MKTSLPLILLFCAALPLPCRAVFCPSNIAAQNNGAYFGQPGGSVQAGPFFFSKKGGSPIGKALSVARILSKPHFFKPKKKRGNGIQWEREPRRGLLSVLLGVAGWTLLLLAFPVAAPSFFLILGSLILLTCALVTGMRGLAGKKAADRFPSRIGAALGSPVALFALAMALSSILTLFITIASVPIFLVILLLGF